MDFKEMEKHEFGFGDRQTVLLHHESDLTKGGRHMRDK